SVGLWWAAPRAIEETLRRQGEHFLGSLHAAEHTGISLFPILALCDRGGIAARGFQDLPDLLGRVLLLLEGCPCEKGCPSCVQSPKCGNGNRPLDKAGAARVLRLLLGREEPVVAWGEAVVVKLAAEEPPTQAPHHPGPLTGRRGRTAGKGHKGQQGRRARPPRPGTPLPGRGMGWSGEGQG